jgi:outer membrane protein OmpA-like peptidoglycan-associated protein
MKNTLRLAWYAWVFLVVVACAAHPGGGLPPTGEELNQMVTDLQRQLEAARADQLDTLAPGIYAKARSAYQNAVQAMDGGKSPSVIESYVAEGHRHLQSADRTGQSARALLAGIEDARRKAFDADAQELGEPFKAAEVLYLKVNQAIEKDNLRFAQSTATELQKLYRDLEVRAIKGRALGPARSLIQKADDDGIEKIVPKALAEAKQSLARADADIENNLYDADRIQIQAAQALFMAQRAMALAASARRFQQLNAEGAALHVEHQVARLSEALEAGDLRNRPFEEQVAELSGAAGKLRKNTQSLTDMNYAYQRQITAMEERIAGLKGFTSQQQASMERLEQARVFNQRFDQVQRIFAPGEAEVLKQGNQLLVRLHAIQFATGTATLPSQSFALLAKVTQALDIFKQAKVLVEGHSDNTGSAEKNQILSRERAEAVRAYLIANSTLAANRIQAVGRGSGRPVAPNDSAQGRAMNRRIDVLITPDDIIP